MLFLCAAGLGCAAMGKNRRGMGASAGGIIAYFGGGFGRKNKMYKFFRPILLKYVLKNGIMQDEKMAIP